MIMAALVAGSIVYAGVRSYRRHRRHSTPVWVIQDGRYVKTSATIVEKPDMERIARRINLNLNLATFSLGLTAAGVLIYAPLIIVSIPFNIYDAVTMFEDTWDMLLTKRSLGTVIVGSAVVAISLAADLHVIAAVVQWLYFLRQKLILRLLSSDLRSLVIQQQAEPVLGAYTIWQNVPQ